MRKYDLSIDIFKRKQNALKGFLLVPKVHNPTVFSNKISGKEISSFGVAKKYIIFE